MDYDLIVIGAGSGGLNIASFMNKAGFKVLLVDKSDKEIGGDCLNYGCIPIKALTHVAKIINQARNSKDFGLKISGKTDISKVMEYVKSKQEMIRKHENAEYFRMLGMHVELGEARFISKKAIKVNSKEFSAKKIIIATGSRPALLKVPGSDKINQLNKDSIFNLKKLPKRLVIIGGGSRGIEMGQAFNMLGSKVTIIHSTSQILPKEDPDISAIMSEELKKQGIEIILNSKPKRFNSSSELVFTDDKNKEKKIAFDEIFVSIGRVLNTENLDLEKANIKVGEGRIVIDDYLRTTNKRVLLCGEVVGSYQFTHAAELHASIIITNFFRSLFKKKLDYSDISWVIYTTPEIATFGMNQAQMESKNISYEKLEIGLGADDQAIIDDYTDGKLILYISRNKILGGTMIAPDAGELVQELILAQSTNMDIRKIFNKTYAYPVAARINKKIITTHFSNKLTKKAKRILRFLYRYD